MATKKIGVIVIGAGRYALRSHLPAIADLAKKGDVELITLVDFENVDVPSVFGDHRDKLDKFLSSKGLGATPRRYVPEEWRNRALQYEDVKSFLDQSVRDLIGEKKFDKTAVVVSTSPPAHRAYIEWALNRDYHVLADKPLSVPIGCAIEEGKAEEIRKDYEELVEIAKGKKRLFMLATQKRYSSVFTSIGKHIERTKMAGEIVPVTCITYETNDGYWLFAVDDYPETFVGPYGSNRFAYRPEGGGGKVTHTGYHILDIIPWLIRHAQPRDIDNAIVYASFWRPQDSFTTLPVKREDKLKFSFSSREAHLAITESLHGLSEVNAQIQIAFRSGKQKRCQVIINLLHEGISGPGKHGVGRLKFEQMNLHQGPVSAVSFRRIAGLDRRGDRKNEIGGSNHQEVFIYRNPDIARDQPVEKVFVEEEDDRSPTVEFFTALARDEIFSEPIVSPVSDHAIGIHLMAAIYESAISDLSENTDPRENTPQPVYVPLNNKKWWRKPTHFIA